MRSGIEMPIVIGVAIAITAFVLPDPVLSPPFSPLISAGIMGLAALLGALAARYAPERPPRENHD